MIGIADHRALGCVDVGLRVLVHPPLVAAVLGRVDGDQPREPRAAGDLAGRVGDQPVMRVDQVDAELVGELIAARAHAGVHQFHPGDERLHVSRKRRRLEAVDDHAVPFLARCQARAAPRQDVHLGAVPHEPLRQLAHVARKTALDDRRILPGQYEDAHRARQTLPGVLAGRSASW